MTASAGIPLRDIHLPQAPGWWPPAPGWWLLAALVLAAAAFGAWLLWKRLRRRRALARLFDEEVAATRGGPERVAAISALLRRAAIGRDPAAAALEGEAWLAYLDRDAAEPLFDGAAGRLLLEGGYRREIDGAGVEALRTAARRRFLELAGGRR